MTDQPQDLPPALAAIGRAFSADGTTRVLAARQPGDTLTSTRVLRLPDAQGFGVLGRMPREPSASHLGVLADISVAQGIRDGIGAGRAMRTLSLHLEQLSPPRGGETLRGAGALLGARPEGAVARGVIVGEDGRLVGEALGRFMEVDGSGYTMDEDAPTEPWGGVAVPEDWSWALPAAGLQPDDGGRVALIAAPETGNSAGMMHGGVQMRLHHLAAERLLGEQGGDGAAPGRPALRPVSIQTTYHRPVPVAGEPLSLDAELVRGGRRVVVTQTRVRGTQAKLLSTAEILWTRD